MILIRYEYFLEMLHTEEVRTMANTYVFFNEIIKRFSDEHE